MTNKPFFFCVGEGSFRKNIGLLVRIYVHLTAGSGNDPAASTPGYFTMLGLSWLG